MLFGAVLQTALIVLIPRTYAVTPALVILLLRAADTIAITLGVKRNPYMTDVIMKKSSAVVPSIDGQFAEEPSNEKVVILMLGAKTNHPMNAFAPHLGELNAFIERMAESLDANAPSNGFLGQSSWFNRDKNGCIQFNLISYWRSIDDLHMFAHDKLHREVCHFLRSS